MLTWFIGKRLAAFERRYGYDTAYVREILRVDRRAFFAYARLGGISSYRRDAPLELYYGAKVTSVVAEDCGPCTQLVVGMALEAGVDPRVIATILEGTDALMSDEARLGVRFARATLAHDLAADELRDEIVRRWGPRALISLAFAIAASRVYPTIKYALGHGQACTRVTVAGEPVIPGARASVVRRVA